MLIHRNDLGCVLKGKPLTESGLRRSKQGLDAFATANQNYLQSGLGSQDIKGGGNGDGGAMITPHGVDRDGDRPSHGPNGEGLRVPGTQRPQHPCEGYSLSSSTRPSITFFPR